MKKIFYTILILFVASSSAYAYTPKGYVWGASLSSVQDELKDDKVDAFYDKKNDTLVFKENKYGVDCKASLLFTPKSSLLAGIAFVWSDVSVFKAVQRDMVKKYGQAIKSDVNRYGRTTYLWYSPTNTYDKVTLIKDPKMIILGYYGGDFYKQYQQEAEDNQ